MKFNSESWVDLNSKSLSNASALDISLAINASGVPYVAYADGSNQNKETVIKFDDTH